MMVNKIKNIITLVLIAIVAHSCTEVIDVQLDQQKYARIVVEAEFSSDTMPHNIKLTKTEDYFSNMPPSPVSGAVVKIYNEDEEYRLTETPPNSGIYLTEQNVFGTVGKEYELNIQLEEAIGEVAEYSASSTIYPINQLDSISLEFHEEWGEQGFWEVKCFALDPPTEDYYMFHILRNGILVNDTIDQVLVVDDILYNGNYTNGIGVGFLDQSKADEKLVPGDKVTLRMARITKEYTDFLWQLQQEVSYQTPLFSGPPANVKGNISNGGFGFFGAYSTSYASTVAPSVE